MCVSVCVCQDIYTYVCIYICIYIFYIQCVFVCVCVSKDVMQYVCVFLTCTLCVQKGVVSYAGNTILQYFHSYVVCMCVFVCVFVP